MAKTAVKADVAGLVYKLERRVGERVTADETILLLESMKMEIPVAAPVAGVIEELLVAEGDEVAEQQPVVILETNGV